MTGKIDKTQELAGLKRLVDAYGADQARWPAADRNRFARLLAEEPEARTVLAQARALDRLLDAAAAEVAPRTTALADRIVAAALAETAGARSNETPRGRVVPLPARGPHTRITTARAGRGTMMPTAALLAACLVAGLYLGGVINLDPVLQNVADTFGIAAEFDTAGVGLADDADEDLL